MHHKYEYIKHEEIIPQIYEIYIIYYIHHIKSQHYY